MTAPANLGRTLIIANPTAQNGAAQAVAERLQRFLSLYLHHGDFDLAWTEHVRHATTLAERAAEYDTVLALGGDGVIHEVANGLMRIDDSQRPALAVVPVGSGNDFAQTLGIHDFSGQDFSCLLACERKQLDIGRALYWNESVQAATDPGVEYFVQTLSFGVDAAIGLGTADMRKKVRLTGAPLYTLSGLEQFGLRYRDYPANIAFDGAPAERVRCIIMAVQLGPTYGSGYRICPDADPTDGLLDVCYAAGPVPRALALPMFLAAKNGGHTKLKPVRMRRCTQASFEFESADYPIQADGERIRASRLRIEVEPAALSVWCPVNAE